MWRETFCHPLYFVFLISWNCDLQATFTYFPLFIRRILWIVPQLFYFYFVFLVHLFYIHHLWRTWLQFMPVLLWKSLVIINCFGFSPVSSFHFASGGWRLATIPLLLHFQYFTFYLNVSKRNSNKSKTSVLCFCPIRWVTLDTFSLSLFFTHRLLLPFFFSRFLSRPIRFDPPSENLGVGQRHEGPEHRHGGGGGSGWCSGESAQNNFTISVSTGGI